MFNCPTFFWTRQPEQARLFVDLVRGPTGGAASHSIRQRDAVGICMQLLYPHSPVAYAPGPGPTPSRRLAWPSWGWPSPGVMHFRAAHIMLAPRCCSGADDAAQASLPTCSHFGQRPRKVGFNFIPFCTAAKVFIHS